MGCFSLRHAISYNGMPQTKAAIISDMYKVYISFLVFAYYYNYNN